MIGQGPTEAAVAERLGDIEMALRGKQEEWLSNRRYPICLSDASVYSENDLVSQLRGGRVRYVVWFGRGDGWDSRRTPGLQQIAETISSVQAEASRPQIAVVCLRYGSRQAAQRLLDAGVTTVLWLTADGLSDACAELYCDVVAPTLSLLEKADETEEHATAVLGQSLQKLWTGHQDSMPEPAGDNYGCIISAAPVAQWAPLAVLAEAAVETDQWLRAAVTRKCEALNLECEDASALQLRACDLQTIEDLRRRLRSTPKLMIVATEDQEEADVRRRSVAHTLCKESFAA
eukprot:COSAG06_NODE_7648_length_2428_cov_18.499785_1_plen_288_part_10